MTKHNPPHSIHNQPRLRAGLTYAGTLPFIAATLLLFFGDHIATLNYGFIGLAYGAVIASFIAGIHWGLYLYKAAPINLFIHSNIAALVAWLALLMPLPLACTLLVLCFVYLLVIDFRLCKAEVIDTTFLQLRIHASTVAIICLSLIAGHSM